MLYNDINFNYWFHLKKNTNLYHNSKNFGKKKYFLIFFFYEGEYDSIPFTLNIFSICFCIRNITSFNKWTFLSMKYLEKTKKWVGSLTKMTLDHLTNCVSIIIL